MKRQIATILSVLMLCVFFAGCDQREITDGEYTIEVALTGGTGRAGVESPAKVVIENGQSTATLVWSSPFYEYMLIDGTQYDPIQEDGNSTFEISIILDEDMTVSASTIAMSQPYLIDYTLHFDSATLKAANQG